MKASTSTENSTTVTCDNPCASSKWLRKSLQYLLPTSKCFYGIQRSFTPQEWDWAALMKSFGSAEASFHSYSYCYLSYTDKNTTEKNYTNSKLKQYWYLKRECVLPTVGKVRICQVLDFLRPSELHSHFQIFHKYKATLPEIKPPLEENTSKSSKIFSNLTSKQILLNLKGLSRQ